MLECLERTVDCAGDFRSHLAVHLEGVMCLEIPYCLLGRRAVIAGTLERITEPGEPKLNSLYDWPCIPNAQNAIPDEPGNGGGRSCRCGAPLRECAVDRLGGLLPDLAIHLKAMGLLEILHRAQCPVGKAGASTQGITEPGERELHRAHKGTLVAQPKDLLSQQVGNRTFETKLRSRLAYRLCHCRLDFDRRIRPEIDMIDERPDLRKPSSAVLHPVGDRLRLWAAAVDGARDGQDVVIVGVDIQPSFGPFNQRRFQRVLGREDQIRISLEIDATNLADAAVVATAGGLHKPAAAIFEAVAWILVAKFLRLPRIAEAINALSDAPFVTGETLRLGWCDRRRVPARAKDLEEPFGAVVHALVFKR